MALGAVAQGSRLRQDGVTLSWQLTNPAAMLGDGIVPFFIDWGMSPHPSTTAAHGPRLIGLRGEHPNARGVQSILGALDIPLRVVHSVKAALIANFAGPSGEVELG